MFDASLSVRFLHFTLSIVMLKSWPHFVTSNLCLSPKSTPTWRKQTCHHLVWTISCDICLEPSSQTALPPSRSSTLEFPLLERGFRAYKMIYQLLIRKLN